jgi:hypothetical protein
MRREVLKGVDGEMKLGLTIAAVGLLASAAFAALESGLKPGATPGAFQVVDVSGPNKGQQLCYRCSYGVPTPASWSRRSKSLRTPARRKV